MNTRATGARRPLTYLSSVLLALASSSAMALGLGDIRVLSRPGQPLVAEIAVITADPSELENLRVGLASPVTFERVGLQRPSGLVSELQFELTRNAQGRAVVRVTSAAPVETASLSFLVEADWGQGRLVREYSALVDAPASALAVAEPEIVAPAGAMSNAIVREAPAVPSAPAPSAAAPRAPAASAPSARPPAPAASADGTLTVQAGQTLSQIAQQLASGQQVSRDRAMIALLRANPEAFIRGNVNLLRQGAVLRVPDRAALAAVDAEQATAMVREHAAQWRQSRTLPQPAAVADAAPAASAAPANAAASAAPRQARLEIAPAVAASAAQAGTTTGTGNGDEGDMLANEQLRQAREDIATRDAEIDELKQRVADLETLQKQQQSLVSLKDTELAAAQQRLAQDNAARDSGGPWYWLGVPVLLLAGAGWWLARRRRPSPLPPLAAEDRDDAALHSSVAAGAGLDGLAEREGWARQEPVFAVDNAPDAADRADNAPLHAEVQPDEPDPADTALPAFLSAGHGAGNAADVADVAAADERAADVPAAEVHAAMQPSEDAHETPAAVQAGVPIDLVPAYAREAEQQPQYRGVFDPPAMTAGPDDAATPQVEVAEAPQEVETLLQDDAGRDRLELAIAYLDLGDAHTARTLLLEVADGGQPHLREQARELLARLS